jgi:hypothetical protein
VEGWEVEGTRLFQKHCFSTCSKAVRDGCISRWGLHKAHLSHGSSAYSSLCLTAEPLSLSHQVHTSAFEFFPVKRPNPAKRS